MSPNRQTIPTHQCNPRRSRMASRDWKALSQWLVLASTLALLPAASAMVACDEQPYDIDPLKHTLGPKHHPMGTSLPTSPSFNQPDQCVGPVRFFDQNANGQIDPEEVRVFGLLRQVDCASCHIESVDADPAQSAGLFLRQNAATLCLVCHKI
jgi:predicted CXXCH cytochrome family protein